MANTRISDLTASASNLASTDLAPIVQTANVGPVKMTGAQIAAGLLSATTPIGSGPILARDASDTLALKNAGNAQIFRVYSTTASSGSYGIISAGVQPDGTTAQADTLYIGSAGAGAAMTKLALVVNGTTRLDYGVTNSGEWYTGSNFKVNGTSWGVTALLVGSSASAIKSSADGVIGVFNNAGTDFSRFQFGGTTSSFPALKRSATGVPLQVRLADDSGDAAFQCGTQTAGGTAFNVNGTGGNSIASVTNTTTGTLLQVLNSSSATLFSVADTPAITLIDAMTIAVGTTTGTKIGTATSQKIGFWNATPIVQPTTAVAAATVAATGVGDVVAASTTFDGYTIPQIVKAMRNAGLLA